MKRASMLMATAIAFGATASSAQDLPASGDDAVQRLDASPRHGEWIRYAAGGDDSVSAWVVYPEREDPAPVVIVIHEIFGLTDWIRGVADQLAAAGFVAIAPDLLSGKAADGGGTAGFDQQGAVRAIRELSRDEVVRRLNAAAEYATGLPATTSAFAAIGFCWGGSTTFQYATRQPGLGAAVVYYGSAPDGGYDQITAPVLGLYGGDDARVNATIPAAREAMQRLGKRYETEVYDGAGHGFLRAQGSREANLAAAREAWPRMVMFLKETLEAM